MDKLFIGCDPDLHKFSAAGVDETGRLIFIALVKLKTVKGSRQGEASNRMITEGIRRFAEWFLDNIKVDHYAVAVEGQNVVYMAMKGANPQDLIELASVAGASLNAFSVTCRCPDDCLFLFPKPSDWKGSVPKSVHQCRTLKKMGFSYEMKGGNNQYPVPDKSILDGVAFGPDKINDGDWQDITDSIGLALYARDEYITAQKRIKK